MDGKTIVLAIYCFGTLIMVGLAFYITLLIYGEWV